MKLVDSSEIQGWRNVLRYWENVFKEANYWAVITNESLSRLTLELSALD